jgi:hypothetical protein
MTDSNTRPSRGRYAKRQQSRDVIMTKEDEEKDYKA